MLAPGRNGTGGERDDAGGKGRGRHRIELRHRPWHGRGARRRGRQCGAELVHRQRRRSCARRPDRRRAPACGHLRPRRHVERPPTAGRSSTAAADGDGAGGHPRQQRRHPARGAACTNSRPRSGTRSSPSTSPPPSTPPPRRSPAMRAAQLGPHRQRRLGARADRLAVQVGLRRRQARPRRPHQGVALELAEERRHLQRHLPRLRADAAGRGADRRPDEGARYAAREGGPRGHAGTGSPRSSSSPSSRSARSPSSSARDAAAQITGTTLSIDGGWTAL